MPSCPFKRVSTVRLLWKSAINNFGIRLLPPGQNTPFIIFFNPLRIFYPTGRVDATKEKMDSMESQLREMLREFKSRSKAKVILESGLFMLILLFLFVGNSLTLLVLLLNRRMRTIPNMFVASLAVSDLLLGVFSVGALGIPTLVTSHWPFNDTICQFQGFIIITTVVASIQTMVLMAVNRYFRIVKSTKYRRYFTKTKTLTMIFVTWLYSICVPLIHLLRGKKMIFHPAKFFCSFPIESSAFLAYGFRLYVGILTCVIIYCYFRIFTTVRRHNNNFPGNPISPVNVEEVKVARTIFVVVVFFNLCWIPVLTIDLVDTARQKWTFPPEAYLAYTFMATISSALNPLIYGVLNKSFRKNYLKVLRCRCCRSQAVVEPLAMRVRASVVAMGP